MWTAIHITIIVLITGLIVFILRRAIGKKEATVVDVDEATASVAYKRMRNLAIAAVFAVVVITAAGAFLFLKYRSPDERSPAGLSGETPGRMLATPSLLGPGGQPRDGVTEGRFAVPGQTAGEKTSPTINALYHKIGPSVVVVFNYNEKGQLRGRGSGFFINHNGDIITSHHVLRGASTARIRTPAGTEHEIKSILAEDMASDLVMASVSIGGGDVRPLSVGATLPDVGERVIVIGSPLGLDQTVSDGIVSAIRTTKDSGKFIQITAPISPGSSGSPVVNMKGEVIGVASSMRVYGNLAQNLNFCTAGDRVSALSAGGGYSIGKMDRPDWEVAEARKKTEEEERIRQQQERYRVIAEIQKLSDEATIRLTAGDNNRAFQLYEQCLSLCSQLNDNQCRAIFLRNMGIAMDRSGKRDEAQQYYKQASEARAAAK